MEVNHEWIRKVGNRQVQPMSPLLKESNRQWPLGKRIVMGLGAVFVLVVIALAFIDEPLRRLIESRVNGALAGYTVRIGTLDFHPLGLSLELGNVTLAQTNRPNEPIVSFPKWVASLHWSKLLMGHLVSEHRFEGPQISVTRSQAETEMDDETDLSDRGWQDAVMGVYPFEINRLEIRDGSFSYTDRPDGPPLELRHIDATAENIRNVESPDRPYPSALTLQSDIFSSGHLNVEGHANFLAQPFTGVDLDFDLKDVVLGDLLPLAGRFGFQVREGTLHARGHTEYSPWAKHVMCTALGVEGLKLDFVHQAATEERERDVASAAEQGASQAADAERLTFEIDEARLSDAELGFVNESASPTYRVFASNLEVTLRDYSNQPEAGPSQLDVQGCFMGNGDLIVSGRFRPSASTPDFSMAVKIIRTKLKSFNKLFRAHADLDVKQGTFALFSELTVNNGDMHGYIKPFFKDVDVYDPTQDEDKGLFQQVYESLVDTLADSLKNSEREEVATTTQVAGPLADPRMSTWEVIINLVRNAFFEAILPGFQRHIGQSA